MIDVKLIKTIYPYGTMKELSRSLRVPLDTARAIIYRGIPKSRHRAIALALLEDIDRQIADLAVLKTRIEKILEETGSAFDPGATSKKARKQSGTARLAFDGALAVVGCPSQEAGTEIPR